MRTRVGAGMLLLAAPELEDPNFTETVILLLDSDAEGALGVVINRPTPVLVADVLEKWRDVVSEPDVLFRGGPVSTDGALGLARPRADGEVPLGYREVVPGLGVIDLDTPVELLEGGLAAARIFVGYAGWGPGQLEDEIAEGSWYAVPGGPADAFADAPHDLRRDVPASTARIARLGVDAAGRPGAQLTRLTLPHAASLCLVSRSPDPGHESALGAGGP